MRFRTTYRQRLAAIQGISLVEVMVALVVLAIIVFGAATFFSQGRRTIEEAAQRRTASEIASQQIELARAGGYDALVDATGTQTVDGVIYTWNLDVTLDLADPGDNDSAYKRISIVVDWPNSRGNLVTVDTAVAP